MRVNYDTKIGHILVENGPLTMAALRTKLEEEKLMLETWTIDRMIREGLLTRSEEGPDGLLYPTRQGALVAAGSNPFSGPQAFMAKWDEGLPKKS